MQGIAQQYMQDINKPLSPPIDRPPVGITPTPDLRIFRKKSEISGQERAAQVLREEEMRKLLGI